MYPLLYADLGKSAAREALPGSGFLRFLSAFCAILAITLLLDAAAPDGPAETIVATDNPAKEGNR